MAKPSYRILGWNDHACLDLAVAECKYLDQHQRLLRLSKGSDVLNDKSCFAILRDDYRITLTGELQCYFRGMRPEVAD